MTHLPTGMHPQVPLVAGSSNQVDRFYHSYRGYIQNPELWVLITIVTWVSISKHGKGPFPTCFSNFSINISSFTGGFPPSFEYQRVHRSKCTAAQVDDAYARKLVLQVPPVYGKKWDMICLIPYVGVYMYRYGYVDIWNYGYIYIYIYTRIYERVVPKVHVSGF